MGHDIFLSYSRHDTETMQRLRDDLSAEGFKVWTDESLTPGTSSWQIAIEKALEEVGCIVVVLSPDAKWSEWVGREIQYASAQGKRVVPVLARGDEQDAIPIALIDAQRVDIRADYSAGVRLLVTAIRAQLAVGLPDSPPAARLARRAMAEAGQDQLDPWNFFDQIRLLWWLFIQPENLATYRENRGEKSLRQTGAWLVSGLVWVPYLAPVVGYVLGTVKMPGTSSDLNIFLVVGGLLLLGAWFITAWIGWHDNHFAGLVLLVTIAVVSFLIFVMIAGVAGILFAQGGGATSLVVLVTTATSIGIAAGVAFRLANAATGALAGVVIASMIFVALAGIQFEVEGGMAGLAMVTVAFGVATALETNLRTGRRSRLGLVMWAIFIGTYAVMMWAYFLGGWGVLAGLGG